MDKNFFLRWILIFVQNIIRIRAVYFLSSPSSSNVRIGDSTTLLCQVNASLSICDWLKNSSSGDSLVISNSSEQYHLLGNLSDGLCHLVVISANHETDSGQWRCRLVTTENVTIMSEEAVLEVLPQAPWVTRVSQIKPGVIIGSLCGGSFLIGGLIVIYCYKRKQPCFLAPSGYPSRSMLIIPSEPPRDQARCYDREVSVHLINEDKRHICERSEASRA